MNRILPIPLLGYWPKSLFPTNHMKSEFEHTLQRSTTFNCVNMLSKIDRSNAKTFFSSIPNMMWTWSVKIRWLQRLLQLGPHGTSMYISILIHFHTTLNGLQVQIFLVHYNVPTYFLQYIICIRLDSECISLCSFFPRLEQANKKNI